MESIIDAIHGYILEMINDSQKTEEENKIRHVEKNTLHERTNKAPSEDKKICGSSDWSKQHGCQARENKCTKRGISFL